MKEITRISLAALPYNIEIEAKKQLEQYLKAIAVSLGANNDAMKEIESRMAELLAERKVTGETVISGDDVAALKQQLGDPKEFIDDADTDELAAQPRTGKRLMRDMNKRMLGGVCAGLAAYLGVDSVWVRLVVLVLVLLSGGLLIPVYLLLWLITPPAQTAAERLQMRGEPVTLQALHTESDTAEPTQPVLLTVIRYMLAACAIVATVAAMTITFYMSRALADQGRDYIGPAIWAYLAPFIAAGVLLTIFCIMLAFMLLQPRATKKMAIALSIVTGLGILSFGIGVAVMTLGKADITSQYQRNQQTVRVAMPALANKKQLTIRTSATPTHPNALRTTYVTTTSEPRVEITYNSQLMKRPTAAFDGTVLRVEADTCHRKTCEALTTVTIYGPQLDDLRVENGSFAMLVPASMAVNVGDQASVDLTANKQLDKLQINVGRGGRVDMVGMGVKEVTGSVAESSTLLMGHVQRVGLTVPVACSTGSAASIYLGSASEVLINGTQVSGARYETPCVQLRSDNN